MRVNTVARDRDDVTEVILVLQDSKILVVFKCSDPPDLCSHYCSSKSLNTNKIFYMHIELEISIRTFIQTFRISI